MSAPVGRPIDPPASPVAADAGLYLHIPFCRTKCHYCDFNTYAGIEDLLPAYVAALGRDIERGAAATDRRGRRMVSVFLGGGTPSLLSAAQAGDLLATAGRAWALPAEAEVTLEANPGSVDAGHLAGLRAAGVNRLSLGAQSLQARGLAALGREHGVEDIGAAVRAARRAGFDNINLDLIYGWPGQTEAEWRADLAAVGALAPEHLSLYPLTVEAGTPLATMVRTGRVRVADDDAMATSYEVAVEVLDHVGYVQYEVSNWAVADAGRAAPTPRHACRHNLLYWRNQEYWGGGPGAHAHWAGRRWMSVRNPRQYIARVAADASLVAQEEAIAPDLAMAETMLLGLRLAEGVAADRFLARHGCSYRDAFGPLIDRLIARGRLADLGDRLVIPAEHRYVLDGIVAEFLP
jgi:oxygen-independent coproporphyrinogen III oxidase